MASENKKKKAKNSYCANALNAGHSRGKRMLFYDPKARQENKKFDLNDD